MTQTTTKTKVNDNLLAQQALASQLLYLKLHFIHEQHQPLATQAAAEGSSHLHFLSSLIEGEANLKQDNKVARLVKLARFPVLKTLDQFQWSWPKKINDLQVKNIFRLQFIKDKANVIFLGGVGLGKTHLSTALGYTACLRAHSVLFTTAIDVVNTLAAAQSAGRLKQELNKYLKPELLILDELGYLPIDKLGADLLFQIISHRYDRGSIVLTSNRAYKHWSAIFNNDSTLTSALLDRLLHKAETVQIEGKSFRMKDVIND
jgi:DNA replication protein DnaC